MLYATTRNHVDAYTAHSVLVRKRGSDGGLFVPFRLPRFSEQEILALGEKSFNANAAEILNLLFGSRLCDRDLNLALGQQSVRLRQLGQKIVMGECWHNTDWQFDRIFRDITALLLPGEEEKAVRGGWSEVGIRMAVLFGIFGSLIREGLAGNGKTVDVSLPAGDFSVPMAAWYGRGMGLPIGNIIICCNENGNLWDFICHGQLKTDGVAKTTLVPEGDTVVPDGLERLISAYGGPAEVQRYVEKCRTGSTYYAEDGFLNRLRQGIYVTVSSDRRILDTVPAAWNTHRYLLTAAAALSYAGLQDYRGRTGAMPTALILEENSPAEEIGFCARALGISREDLKSYFNV